MKNVKCAVLILLMLPLFASAQEIRLAEKLSMQTPEGITILEDAYRWSKSRGYCDSYVYTVYIIPLETEMPDGNIGVISERYKDIKTMDTLFVSKQITRLIESKTEKFYQWTKDYVKKKFVSTDSSKWKYVYTFASHTNTEMVFVIVETTNDDNYATIDSILSSFEYNPGFLGKTGHAWSCAGFWWFLLFFVLVIFGLFVFLDRKGLIWPLIFFATTICILLIVTEGDIIMIFSILTVFTIGWLLAWLQERNK